MYDKSHEYGELRCVIEENWQVLLERKSAQHDDLMQTNKKGTY